MTEHALNNEDSCILSPDMALSGIAKDIVKYAPSKIVTTIAGLLLVPLYTNLLTPDEYGLYNVSVAALSFLCIIFSDWIGLSALRFFKEHKDAGNVKPYFTTLLFLLVVNLTVMYIVGSLSFKTISNFFKVPSHLLLMVLLLIIPVAIRALLFQVLRAQIRPWSYTVSVIFNQLATIAVSVYFIKFWHFGGKALLFGMLFSIVITDFIMIFQSQTHKAIEVTGIKQGILKDFYRYGGPIALSSVGMWIISQSNKFVIQYFKGSYYNGILGVGYNLTFSIIMPLFAIITLAAVPRIFERYEAGEDTNPIISKLTGYYFVFFSPIILILCLFSKELVAMLSNKQYAEAQIIIPFLALSMFMLGLSEYTTLQYHLTKKTYIDTIIRIIPGLLGLGLSILLVPTTGILGVGISTLASYGLYLVLSVLVNVKNLSWILPYREIKVTFIGLVACFIGYLGLKMLSPQQNFMNAVLEMALISLIYTIVVKLQCKRCR